MKKLFAMSKTRKMYPSYRDLQDTTITCHAASPRTEQLALTIVAGLLYVSEVDNQNFTSQELYGAVCAGSSTGQTALERRAFLGGHISDRFSLSRMLSSSLPHPQYRFPYPFTFLSCSRLKAVTPPKKSPGEQISKTSASDCVVLFTQSCNCSLAAILCLKA